jgi:hypothetical protein
MTQDEHLAAAILNEIYDTKINDRIQFMAAWVAKIKRDERERCAKVALGTAPAARGNFFAARRNQCDKIANAIRSDS